MLYHVGLFGVPETQIKTHNTDRSGLPILLCILENPNKTPHPSKIIFSGAVLLSKRLYNNLDANRDPIACAQVKVQPF